MNQTKKRLSIINLAISITDIETIQLQILKLGLLKTDEKIQEIIAVLQAENYAKAQRLIKSYIDTPMDEILQRASQQKASDTQEKDKKEDTIISEEDQKIIDEFQLFTTNSDNSQNQVKKKEININDYLTDTLFKAPKANIDKQESDFDDLLKLEAEEIMPDNIDIDLSQDANDSFFDIPTKEDPISKNTDDILQDNFFAIDENKQETTEPTTTDRTDPFEALLSVEAEKKATLIKDALDKQAETKKAFEETLSKKKAEVSKDTKQSPTSIQSDSTLEKQFSPKPKSKEEPESYPPISYIRQKFVSMRKQYEPIQKGHDRFPTVETFLTTISHDGYKEKEIEETLEYIEKLIKEQKFSEAAQLLLVCASTESKFAQLMLARELYRGILLRKNIAEAFYILTHMADDHYPEALCDLGQFYENGIGTGRDKKVAKELYKKAMDLGIKRAEKHYARLKKQTKGFFKK